VNENKVGEFMKKHPAWFIFDFHPIRFIKKSSDENEEETKETVSEE